MQVFSGGVLYEREEYVDRTSTAKFESVAISDSEAVRMLAVDADWMRRIGAAVRAEGCVPKRPHLPSAVCRRLAVAWWHCLVGSSSSMAARS